MAIREVYQNGVLVATEEYTETVRQAELYPYEFLSLMTPAQVVAVQTSADPQVIVLKSKLQTIVSPMPFTVGSELHQALLYLAWALPELFTESEVARILVMQPPE